MSLNGIFEQELRAIFLRAMKGETVAYERFLTTTQGFVTAYLARLGRGTLSTEERGDRCQEILLSIHLKRQTYTPYPVAPAATELILRARPVARRAAPPLVRKETL